MRLILLFRMIIKYTLLRAEPLGHSNFVLGIAFAKSDILNQIILNIYTKTKKIFICWNCVYLPILKLKEKKQKKF